MADMIDWLRHEVDAWRFDAAAILLRPADQGPIAAQSFDELLLQLGERGALAPLPRESAALANVMEQSLLKHLTERLDLLAAAGWDVRHATGGERGYPDLDVGGMHFAAEASSAHHAIDIKVARRAAGGRRTQSRITLYTGNTYFKYPDLHWPGTLRPFGSYASHLDILVIYDLLPDEDRRTADVEVVVQPSWSIASRKRSSTTREYIGAVDEIERLRSGRGEFDSPEEFYTFWRAFPFKNSGQVTTILYRLLRHPPATA